MEPGFYVVRMPKRGTGSRLIVESRPFRQMPDVTPGYARDRAEELADVLRNIHTDDDVFVIERP